MYKTNLQKTQTEKFNCFYDLLIGDNGLFTTNPITKEDAINIVFKNKNYGKTHVLSTESGAENGATGERGGDSFDKSKGQSKPRIWETDNSRDDLTNGKRDAATEEVVGVSTKQDHKRLVSDDRLEELQRKLKIKLSQLNVGIDPELISIGSELSVAHVERGLTKFVDFEKTMISLFGDNVTLYLKMFYNAARDFPNNSFVDEIDDVRIANLEKQGFGKILKQDGTLPFNIEKVDGVITNPPFGSKTSKEYKGYKIAGLAEQMVLNSLDNLSDNGRASIIIGGHTKYKENGTLASEKGFINYLYNYYNVSDIINIDGGLYYRQGTSFPIRLILLDGKRKDTEMQYAPLQKDAKAEVVDTFNELFNRINNLHDEKILQQQGTAISNNGETGHTSSNGRSYNNGSGHIDREDSADNRVEFGGRRRGHIPSSGGSVRLPARSSEHKRHDASKQEDDGGVSNVNIDEQLRRVAEQVNRDGANRDDKGGDRGAVVGQRSDVVRVSDHSNGVGRKPIKVDVSKEKTEYHSYSKSIEIGSVIPTNTVLSVEKALSEFDDIEGVERFIASVGDKDVRYRDDFSEEATIIQQAEERGTYLKAPNGEPTNLTSEQWVQVRTTAFKEWFGDWELSFMKDFLLNSRSVSVLTGDEFSKKDGISLTEQVAEYFKSIGGKATSRVFGDVILDKRGADDSLAHGIGRVKAIAYASVKEVIENIRKYFV